MSGEHTIFISLGTNLGERENNLAEAIGALAEAVFVAKQSAIYQTEPWGYTEQPRFLNQVVQGTTSLSLPDLLQFLKGIEKKLGRQGTFRYGPRLIDLDVLFYDDVTWQSAELTVPHPRLHERAFVIVPLAELAENWIHPVLRQSMADLYHAVNREGVELYRPEPDKETKMKGQNTMDEIEIKPFKWTPGAEVGFSVTRRADGGMNFVFRDTEPGTLEIWRKFALDHLFESDRLTRNMYDIRQLKTLTEEAIQMAVEVNSDPSARNIRLAVVVGNAKMRETIQRVAGLTTGGGTELKIFEDINEAEAWLNRPINLLA